MDTYLEKIEYIYILTRTREEAVCAHTYLNMHA
jgi:hypothetical protein